KASLRSSDSERNSTTNPLRPVTVSVPELVLILGIEHVGEDRLFRQQSMRAQKLHPQAYRSHDRLATNDAHPLSFSARASAWLRASFESPRALSPPAGRTRTRRFSHNVTHDAGRCASNS